MATVLENLQSIQGMIRGGKNISAGDFTIQSATIVQGSGAAYPIGQYIRAINLFEDMTVPGITGWLDIEDPTNLPQAGPIVGEELLQLKFETPGGSELENFSVDFTQNPLCIHSVQQIKYSSSELTYRLHFCSPEMVQNKRIRISKTYQGLVSDIVPDILKNVIGTSKKIKIEPTIANRHYVVPNQHPFDFIGDLTGAAQAKEKLSPSWAPTLTGKTFTPSEQIFKGLRSDFMFYEGVNGYNFVPVSTPDMDTGLEFTISVTDTNTGNDGGHRDSPSDPQGYRALMLRAREHSIINAGDKLSGINTGTWGGTHIRHNGVTKSFKIYKSDYLNALKDKKFSHITETPTFDPNNIVEARNIAEWPKGHIRFTSSSSMADTGISKNNGHIFYPSQVATPTLSLERQMQIGHFRGQLLKIQLPGISGLRVGMGAYANLPDIGLAAGEKGLKGSELLAENRFDNFWVITRIGHSIKTFGPDAYYNCEVELSNTMALTQDKLPDYNAMIAL